MKKMTKYIANDGTEFKDESSCAQYELECDYNKIQVVLNMLSSELGVEQSDFVNLLENHEADLKETLEILECKPEINISMFT